MTRYLDHSPKTAVLVGMGPSIVDILGETLTQELGPAWTDEVWAINMAANVIWHDVVFWMDDLDAQEKFKPGLFALLRRRNKPVITSRANRKILPTSYDYPIQEVSEIAIPIFGKPYLNNGVAMAIAYAIWKGITTLRIYGADFNYPNRDYAESGRACVEAWITVALSKNMLVEVAPSSSLFDAVRDHEVYGYAEQPEIVLPNGLIWRYVKTKAGGKYVATDSSGQPVAAPKAALGATEIRPHLVTATQEIVDAIRGRVSRVDGQPTEAAGNAGPAADQVAEPETPAAPVSGAGLRDPDRLRRPETQNPPSPGRGRGRRRVRQTAKA